MRSMNSKSILFFGIALLLAGIALRKLTSFELIGLLLILTGVCCKMLYIIAKVKEGAYQPGMELIFLVVGLFLFLSGLYLQSQSITLINPLILIVIGLSFKIVFIFQFIRIVRSNTSI